MKYSIFSWFGYFMPFADRIHLIKEAGFEEVMISWEDEFAPTYLHKETFPDTVRNAGLEITNFHAPYRGYNDIWEKPFKENGVSFSEFVSMIEDCRRFNVDTLVVHTNDLNLSESFKYENGLAFFSGLAESAERCNVNLAVENVSRQYLLRYVLDRIQTSHFGMCYDTSHDFIQLNARGQIIHDYYNRVKALHISDNDLLTDRHWIPTEGKIPFEKIMPMIKKTPMKVFSGEIIANERWRQKKPAEFLKQSLIKLKEIEQLG